MRQANSDEGLRVRVQTNGVILTSATTKHLLDRLFNDGFNEEESIMMIRHGIIKDRKELDYYDDGALCARKAETLLVTDYGEYTLIPDKDGVVGVSYD